MNRGNSNDFDTLFFVFAFQRNLYDFITQIIYVNIVIVELSNIV